ncbi:MAG: hypothetical protein KDA37_08690, partial [Planctomycetales bacterium]|nr:hypothetical protein [Planctomycetales bacterium]
GEHGGRRHRSPRSGPINGARVLDYGSPNLVLVDRTYEHAVGVMQDNDSRTGGAWSLLYRDGVAELWGRASLYDQPNSPLHLPDNLRVSSEAKSERTVQWPAFPLRRTGGLASGPAFQSGSDT